MRLLWKKVPVAQLDLLDARLDAASQPTRAASTEAESSTSESLEVAQRASTAIVGWPLCIAIGLIDEDPNNPRTEFPDAETDELAVDMRQCGILQPLVVHPADAQGRHRLHFGAKRLRAALRAGFNEVPVVVRDASADPYDQVAENQKRHALPPLDLPPALDQALRAGRCTSPRTLHELSQPHEVAPEEVRELLDSSAEITRTAVATLKADSAAPEAKSKAALQTDALARAPAACDRLERALARIDGPPPHTVALPELVALRIRVEDLTRKWLWSARPAA